MPFIYLSDLVEFLECDAIVEEELGESGEWR